MKNKPLIILVIMFFSLSGNAQLFDKLKEKVLGKEDKKEGYFEGQYYSEKNQVFKDWDKGEVDIVAVIFSEKDESKRTHKIGTIQKDGNFSYQLPDSISTSIPITAYKEECNKSDKAKITNPNVKLALAILYISKEEKIIGGIIPADPFIAAFNVNQSNPYSGYLGKHYLLIYSDGDTSLEMDCEKKVKNLDGTKTLSKANIKLKDNMNLDLKKGWNFLRMNVTSNQAIGNYLYYLERDLNVVSELPDKITWVYKPYTQ